MFNEFFFNYFLLFNFDKFVDSLFKEYILMTILMYRPPSLRCPFLEIIFIYSKNYIFDLICCNYLIY